MKVLYCRVSTLDQKTDRQKIDENNFDLVVEDKCSGSILFFLRPGGKEIQNLMDKGVKISLSLLSIDRMGRDARDIANTIHHFTENKISITFISQGLTTLDENGKENPISKMVISILSSISEITKVSILENQKDGIRIAKMKGIYKGRVKGSSEDVLQFLAKEKNKKSLELLKKGYKAVEVSKITGVNQNTITKIKKLGLATPS